ncbi:hypothetical protein Sjap_015540 [Stephania japonica]|uniref:Uncharacterized protein n=1 Tax=Stephania japonica TaxID=461633 RepID=A0AAP0IJG3_9MAGN
MHLSRFSSLSASLSLSLTSVDESSPSSEVHAGGNREIMGDARELILHWVVNLSPDGDSGCCYTTSNEVPLHLDSEKLDTYVHQHGAPDDEHEAPGDEEVEQELQVQHSFEAPPQSPAPPPSYNMPSYAAYFKS